ncbi:MAG: hypothetical protein PVJ07_09400 [Anaerolineales bacterium]
MSVVTFRDKAVSVLMICGALILVLSSCSPSAVTTTDEGDQTAAPMPTEAIPEPTQEPSEPELPEPTEEPTEPPLPEPTQTPTSTPEIVHLMMPGEPGASSAWATDRSSIDYADERRSVAEDFKRNLFERPFTAEVMDYEASIDLVMVSVDLASPWVYITLELEGPPPEGASTYYGVEFDLDFNGRGEFLLMGQVPAGTEWTTDMVFIYQDQNGDVGGDYPLVAEDPSPEVDGYEALIFEQGIGVDPDAGWIRRDPDEPNQVQLAIKWETLGSDTHFAFGGFVDGGMQDPAAYDYNDFHNLTIAGSPYAESGDYPIKAIALFDNTCRWYVGDAPAGGFVGQCSIPTPEGCQPPPGGCPQGSEWWPDWCVCGAN